MAKQRNDYTQHGIVNGYRSGFEERISSELAAAGVRFSYEKRVINYVIPERPAKYTPDFELFVEHNGKPDDTGIIVEAKGRFLTKDRQKMILVKKQHPNLDIRIVFSNANTKISKQSKTTYGMWCEKHGFQYASKSIPEEWYLKPKGMPDRK